MTSASTAMRRRTLIILAAAAGVSALLGAASFIPPGEELPRVLDGAGFGIVEDVGGTGGLEALAKAFKKKKGTDYKQYSEWLGTHDLDMTAFDMDDMNFRLKKIPRIYKQCYEDRLTPTQRSIDLIERKYLRKKP